MTTEQRENEKYYMREEFFPILMGVCQTHKVYYEFDEATLIFACQPTDWSTNFCKELLAMCQMANIPKENIRCNIDNVIAIKLSSERV